MDSTIEHNIFELLANLLAEVKELQEEGGAAPLELAQVVLKIQEAEMWFSRSLEV